MRGERGLLGCEEILGTGVDVWTLRAQQNIMCQALVVNCSSRALKLSLFDSPLPWAPVSQSFPRQVSWHSTELGL